MNSTNTTVGQLSRKSDPSEEGWGYPTQVFEHTPRRVWPARALKPQLVHLSFAAFLRRKAPRLILVSSSAQGLLTLYACCSTF